ncbi:ABC transporter ATP-binding protein [bacterium]|nr:ABC transporter ATP-binding protein [bacterium]
MTDIAVRLENIFKSFDGAKVLDGISFDVKKSTLFCILGRSGTGKSVTLKHIIGLVKPDSGRIFVEDEDITHMARPELIRIRKKLGFLFQYAALFDSITVFENVAFPLRRHTKLSEPEIKRIVTEKLASVGLEKDLNKMPDELSGGMKKRVGLARALAMEPSILLVDEPSAGLDPITSAEIDELILELKRERGVTVVMVTHNIPSARRLADELVFVNQGRLAARGTVTDLERSEDPLVRAFMMSEDSG